MRLAAYLVMVVLASVALATGEIALALSIGGAKALIVGVEFMELRHAAWPHLFGFGVFSVFVTLVLLVML